MWMSSPTSLSMAFRLPLVPMPLLTRLSSPSFRQMMGLTRSRLPTMAAEAGRRPPLWRLSSVSKMPNTRQRFFTRSSSATISGADLPSSRSFSPRSRRARRTMMDTSESMM